MWKQGWKLLPKPCDIFAVGFNYSNMQIFLKMVTDSSLNCIHVICISHQEMEYPLRLGWTCDWFWPTECCRQDIIEFLRLTYWRKKDHVSRHKLSQQRPARPTSWELAPPARWESGHFRPCCPNPGTKCLQLHERLQGRQVGKQSSWVQPKLLKYRM